MKKTRITYLIIACLFIGGSLHAQAWKAKAISDLNKGEFAKVEQAISKLSEAEKGKHAWLIDSLQAMMSRIRDDFRLSREEGKKLLLEKVPGATDKQIESWKQKKIEFINLFPLFTEKGTNVLRKELTFDGLHLKEEGYKIWVDAIKKKMK